MKRHAEKPQYKPVGATRAMDLVLEKLWAQFPQGIISFPSQWEASAAQALTESGTLVYHNGQFFLSDKGIQRLEDAGNSVREDMGAVMQESLMEAAVKRTARTLRLAQSVTHKGRRFVLTAERAVSPTRAKMRVNNCKGDGVTFSITIIAELAKDKGVEDLLPKDYSFKGLEAKKANVNVSKVTSYGGLPQRVLEHLENGAEGELVKKRLQRSLGEPDENGKKAKKKDLPNVFLITADGGWNWSSKNGHEGLGLLTQILHLSLGTNNKVVFSQCVNNLEGEGQTLL